MIYPMDLTGKHVIITGASSGIGRATCVQASKLGAKVSMIARNEEKLQETLSVLEGEGHSYYSFNLNETDAINLLVKKIIEKDGKIDGLVHSAGFIADKPIKLDIPAPIEAMMRIHYFAFVELIRALASNIRPQRKQKSTPPESAPNLR